MKHALLLLVAVGDPAPARAQSDLPEPLTLEAALGIARSRRSEIAAARAKARALSERPAIDSALEDPMISPSLDHLPFELHGADASLAIEQRIPLSRIRGHREKASEAEASRARARVDVVRLDVELEATKAFLMLYERRQMLRIVTNELDLARQMASAANARYAAATGMQPEVLRAEIEVARGEGMLKSLSSEIEEAEAMLNSSLARAPEAQLPALAMTATAAAPSTWVEVKERALDARPELESGRAEVRRAEAEIEVMDSMYLPMATIRTGPAYTMTDGFGWMLMFGISVPLWRDRLGAGVREAQAMADMARADLDAMRNMVEGEAAASRHAVMAARARYLSLRDDVVPRARRAVDPALASYASGMSPLVSVLEAVESLWSREEELVKAEVELGLAWARLHRATGGTP